MTKPINPARIFASFCNFFSQREKVGVKIVPKKTRYAKKQKEIPVWEFLFCFIFS